jgi:hypothetical protein
MVLTVLLAIAVFLAFSALVFLFSPLQVKLRYSVGAKADVSLAGSFLHPGVVSFTVDAPSRKITIRLFGWPVVRKGGVPAQGDTLPSSMEDKTVRHNDDAVCLTPVEEPFRPEASPSPKRGFVQAEGTEAATLRSSAASAQVNTSQPSVDSASLPTGGEAGSVALPPIHGPNEENVAAAKKKKDNWFERLRHNRVVFFVGNHAWRRKVLRWVARVVRALFTMVRFNRFAVSVRAGVEDPMLTGTIAGLHRAVAGALAAKPPFAISFEPVFMKNHFECTGAIGIRTAMVQLLLPLFIALITFPTLHTLYLWWRFTRLEKRRNREVGV